MHIRLPRPGLGGNRLVNVAAVLLDVLQRGPPAFAVPDRIGGHQSGPAFGAKRIMGQAEPVAAEIHAVAHIRKAGEHAIAVSIAQIEAQVLAAQKRWIAHNGIRRWPGREQRIGSHDVGIQVVERQLLLGEPQPIVRHLAGDHQRDPRQLHRKGVGVHAEELGGAHKSKCFLSYGIALAPALLVCPQLLDASQQIRLHILEAVVGHIEKVGAATGRIQHPVLLHGKANLLECIHIFCLPGSIDSLLPWLHHGWPNHLHDVGLGGEVLAHCVALSRIAAGLEDVAKDAWAHRFPILPRTGDQQIQLRSAQLDPGNL